MNTGVWIAAAEVVASDVLEFGAITSTGVVDGLPIKKLTRRHRDGRVSIEVVHPDGLARFKHFAPGDRVCIKPRTNTTTEGNQ